MSLPKIYRNGITFMMVVLLSNVPVTASAATASNQMLSTSFALEEMSRKDAEKKVEEFMSRDEVKQVLIQRGLSEQEVSKRIAALSDSEVRQLAGQVEHARAGGDILFTVLIVVLIIFLVKRI